MRWLRFSVQGQARYGIVQDEVVREVKGNPFDGYETTAVTHPLASVKIEVPVVPPTFYCVGLNYAEHVIEAAKKLGIKADLPQKPDVGYRANNALLAHGGDVIIPADAT
ncbi:MAG: DUF2437 domain-containing protein, partial [Proteobacteria bacterium]|nr:DUF2437 domain-containing protein [Pseudomonadota bacterium]